MAHLYLDHILFDGKIPGWIEIGPFRDAFSADVLCWSIYDYYRHWKLTVNEALLGHDIGIIVAWGPIRGWQPGDPYGGCGLMYPIYWVSETEFAIQEHLILREDYNFEEIEKTMLVKPRPRCKNASEWIAPIDELKDLAVKLSLYE